MAAKKPRQNRAAPEPIDGRERRGLRNREKIVQAIYELVRENEALPTAEQVARRARVGDRTVFRHFADMEALSRDMRGRVQGEVMPLLLKDMPIAQGNQPLARRIDALVDKRAAVFEHLAPFRHVARIVSGPSDDGYAELTRFLRTEITLVFAEELKKAPDHKLEAADAIASFEMWDRLRREQRLGRDRAKKAVSRALLAIFTAT